MGIEELYACAGYDGRKKRKGSKVRLVVDTLGQLLAASSPPTKPADCYT